jgi:plastocyanin
MVRLLLAGLVATAPGCGRHITAADPFSIPVQLDPNPIVRINTTGVSPQVSHLAAGVAVRFVNEDGVAHQVAAAPELGYGDCPELASIGTLQPGASRSVTVARTDVYCAFHDQANPANFPYQGLLVVH